MCPIAAESKNSQPRSKKKFIKNIEMKTEIKKESEVDLNSKVSNQQSEKSSSNH